MTEIQSKIRYDRRAFVLWFFNLRENDFLCGEVGIICMQMIQK